MAFVYLLLAWWIAAGVGQTLLGRLPCLKEHPLERFVYSSTLGLGLVAYGVYLMGMLGFLRLVPISLWWLALAGLGWKGQAANLSEALLWARRRNVPDAEPDGFSTTEKRMETWGIRAAIACLLILGLLGVIGCYHLPDVHAWDALAYHLADPKLFLMHARIVPLPTEHHSNFPFTMEMLFTVGLLYQGTALAALFQWLAAVLIVLALLAFASRLFSPLIGYVAGLIFVSTPLVFWESTIAYIDLGLALYTTLATFAALSLTLGARKDPWSREAWDWALLAGIMIGFGLGVKYLAIVPFAGIGAYLILGRVSPKLVLLYTFSAVMIGSPWYLKNLLRMQNPVYPYLFKVFPHSRYWSADRAERYQKEQASFGYSPGAIQNDTDGHGDAAAPGGPGVIIRNLLLTPWTLIVEPQKYQNRGNFTFTEWNSALYAAFCFSLVRIRRWPQALKGLMALAFFQCFAWFFISQVGRYLLSVLPLLALLAGCGALYSPPGNKVGFPGRIVLGGFMLGGQFLLLLWGLFVLPVSGRSAIAMQEQGLAPTALSIPEVVAALQQPETASAQLRRRLDVYNVMEWINRHTSKEEGVVLYEEVLGFYLDRPYVWGNGEHSSYIGYEGMKDGAELTKRLEALGIRYVLINLNHSEHNNPLARQQENQFPTGPGGHEWEALQAWYARDDGHSAPWRRLVADAIRRNLWKPILMENTPLHGVLLLALPEADTGRAIRSSTHDRIANGRRRW